MLFSLAELSAGGASERAKEAVSEVLTNFEEKNQDIMEKNCICKKCGRFIVFKHGTWID